MLHHERQPLTRCARTNGYDLLGNSGSFPNNVIGKSLDGDGAPQNPKGPEDWSRRRCL